MGAIANDWLEPLSVEFRKPYYKKLYDTVKREYETRQIFPDANDIFNAFEFTPLSQVKVVILGQDPYPEPEQAHGLAFSVRPGVPLPRSLRNIYKEREADLGLPPAQTGCLIPWACAGVLLINTVLTVDAGQANSHAKFGWQTFTDAVFRILWQLPQPVAFVLWGKQAQIKLERAIDAPAGGPRLVHTSAHPSPLSAKRGFFGSRPFSQVDAFLRENGAVPISWAL